MICVRDFACMAVGAFVVVGAMLGSGIRINRSDSMPEGLWHTTSISRLRKGDRVMACLPHDIAAVAYARGYLGPGSCPDRIEPVVKLVAAVGGDTVRVHTSGVSVDGEALPHSAPLAFDRMGRVMQPFPIGTYKLSPAEVWLYGTDTEFSFDSRYFGPVKTPSIVKALKPLWVTK